MRAIIIATGEPTAADAVSLRCPTAMLPLLDRPFVQHVVEFLVARGITRVDFVLSHLPEKVESWFGQGDRWGITFNYHLVRHPDHICRLLKAIVPDSADVPILLADGDRLPLDEAICQCPMQDDAMPTTFIWRQSGDCQPDGPPQGTGWSWVLPGLFEDVPADMDMEQLYSLCIDRAQVDGRLVEVQQPLSAETYPRLLESHRRVFRGEASGLLMTGREVEPGIWISRNVSLPSSVRLTPPVYLGSNARIGQGVTLGPNVVIGEGSVLDRHCTVRNSLVLPGSFIGESLELADLIVDRNRVVDTRLGIDCPVSEHFIVGSMEGRPVHDWLAGVFSRAVAIGMLVVTWPVLLLTAAYLKIRRAGPVLRGRRFVRLPALSNPAAWTICRRWSFLARPGKGRPGLLSVGLQGVSLLSDLLLDFLPSLVNIAKGELHFVGVRPRDLRQLEQLPRDWRELVLRSKAGLITEAFVRFGKSPSDDDLYSAEAFYAVRAGIRYDLKLLAGWFGRVAFGVPRADGGSFSATLETTSDIGSLERIRAFVGRMCREELWPPMDEEDTYKVVVAVQEVVTNVMRHAYHGSADGTIKCEAKAGQGQLTIKILHQGDGLDPRGFDSNRARTQQFAKPREGGFGLYIISQYVDDVLYSCDGKGTHCVTLTINLSGGLSRGSSNREDRRRDDHRVAVRED